MKMLISEYNSKKITVLNTLLIVFVLLLHSYYTEASIYPISQSIQLITGAYGLTGIAVPMFFMLSGMLFFNGIFTVKDCFPKMKKRVRSLLIPYILWNIFFVVWYVILQNLPGLSASINNNITGKVFTPNIISNIYELFWTPVNFPLWFLRDLIVMVAISPILYYVIKYLKWFAPIIVLSLSPFVHLPISSFFLLGGCIAMHSSLDVVSVKVVGGGIFWPAVLIYVGNAIAQVFTNFHHPYITFVVCLCGIICIWRVYDLVVKKAAMNPKQLSLNPVLGYSFFVYLFHEPAFNIIKKAGLMVLGVHEWSLIILYFINPLIMCIIAIAVAKVLQKFVPKMYSILVGGR